MRKAPERLDLEVCYCAAWRARTPEGRVTWVYGKRHPHCLKKIAARGYTAEHTCDAQGFRTTHGRDVDRIEGLILQKAAGVESKDPGGYRGNELFSEDLY